jgi:membrane-associated protein
MLDPDTIIQTGSLLILALVVFAETGLLIGFFLPGDSLLLAAGFFAAQEGYSIHHSGYLIGRKAGPRLFKRKDGIFFRQEYIEKTQAFFETHGGKTILLARFIPIVRTFVSFVAGMGRMDMRQFVFYNILGGMLWVGVLCYGGYKLGSSFPEFEDQIKWMLVLFAPLSLLVGLLHVFKNADSRRRLRSALKEEWAHFFGRK